MLKKSQNNPLKYLKYLPFLLLIPSLVLNFFLYQKLQKTEKGLKVIEVLDGDTLVIEDKSIIKLFSIEAPELDLCGGKEAKEELEKLVFGKNINFETKVRDKYGRQLALVYQGSNFINLKMLESGWAEYNGVNFEQKELLLATYQKAKEEKLGIYGPECFQTENPEHPECLIKGNISQKSTREKIYHFPGCSGYNIITIEKYRGEDWFCTEKETQEAGFRKSENCYDKEYTQQ